MADVSIVHSYKSSDHTSREGSTKQRTLTQLDARSKGSRPSIVQKNHARVIQACQALAIDPSEMKMK